MQIGQMIVFGMALALSYGCAYTDWKEQKIFNKHTFPMMGVGLVVNTLFWGLQGLSNSFLGLLLGLVLFALFAVRVLRAGDVKLFMALGAVAGWRMNLRIIIGSILLGGVAAILVMAAHRNAKERFLSLWMYMKRLFLFRQWESYEPEGKGVHFRFGVCIAAAATLAILQRSMVLWHG